MHEFKKMMSSRTRRAVGRCGFSLIELLVVIAVLGIVFTILVPQLTRAQDSAKLATCKSRLRNLGVGLRMYATDNNGKFPVSEYPCNPHLGLIDSLEGKYVTSVENFYCPNQTDDELAFTDGNVQAGRIGYFYYSCEKAPTYKLHPDTNKTLRNFGGATPNWPRQIDISMAEELWLMSDIWFSGVRAHPFGKKGMNFLRVDGSVGFVEGSPASVFK